ncbi:MAG: GAF domain-containing protein [Gemmatimonadota bacterium]|nr:GAF domain-containing protein [Gemmatimonadota bacterium]MDH3369496.1 GAF domain-containing protein [Gemmatimonadota bacterium]MDH3478610.1 GAF domain-containing protein [Gemmatimonadota bacterium]MDH3569990.1 GAF domain-containing protein [Gemmatimonadota bacterium]MDH5550516.1 GAF domain-containing protein [Gemmatimonadota bacterium]
MKYLLWHPGTLGLDHVAATLEAEGIELRTAQPGQVPAVTDVPTVFVLDPPSRTDFSPDLLETFVRSGGSVALLGAPGESDVPEVYRDSVVSAYVAHPPGRRQLLVALRTVFRESAARQDTLNVRREVVLRTRELAELTRIGMALATERDYSTLLESILTQALHITQSDAGSLYIVETPENQPRCLRFTLSQTQSRPDIPFVEFTMPLDATSIAGNAAITGKPLVIRDVYQLPPDVAYTFNRSFDQTYGYRSKSMLAIPMKDHKDQVIGVLQLINRKRHADTRLSTPDDFAREVVSYSQRQVDLVSALAGQAAVSIENSRLYEDIERLFEGFVRASVTAIEQRDPTTFGHSGRVASMTVALAKTVDREDRGLYRPVRFSREEIRAIRYAGLLHDFGKVGVREQVLVKEKKLYPPDLAQVKLRHAFIRRSQESEYHKQRMLYLEERGNSGYEEFVKRLDAEHSASLRALDEFLELVRRSNEPTVLPEGSFEHLIQYAEQYYHDLDGKPQPYLTDDELRFLSIRKGSLDESERLEIESHVTHTYRFLLQIPWTKELQSIPSIAYGHHEKLDGTGYPRSVRGNDIPIQTRMMTIADIFDALTASDRPYKRAVAASRALDILTDETGAGMLDSELFRLFREARVFEHASDDDGA